MKKLLCIVQTLLILSCSGIDNESVTDACNGDSPVYLAANGVTIKACANSNVGDEGVIDGITYTVVDEEMLLEIIENQEDVTKLATTKVSFMSSIFFQDSSFNQAIGNWDVSINPSNKFYNSAATWCSFLIIITNSWLFVIYLQITNCKCVLI